MSETKFKKGDRVRVRAGKNHDAMTKLAIGEIVEIATPALGVKFEGMDGVHKWYTDEELERWANKGSSAPNEADKKMKM